MDTVGEFVFKIKKGAFLFLSNSFTYEAATENHCSSSPTNPSGSTGGFPQGNRYMQLRDTLGTVYEDMLFADLFPQRGQPAHAPWQLALMIDGPDAIASSVLCNSQKTFPIDKLPMRLDVLRHPISRIDWK